MELALFDQLLHQRFDAGYLRGVVAQRVDDPRVVHTKREVVAVVHYGVLLDDLRHVTRRRVGEGEHRRDMVAERVEGRQVVAAAVERYDRAVQRQQHRLALAAGRNLLRIVVRQVVRTLDDGIETHALRVRVFYETLECPLLARSVGAEQTDILLELPVVAILHAAEQPAAYGELLQGYGALGFVQMRHDHDAAAAALQLFGEPHDEIDQHLALAFGQRARLGHHDHLVETEVDHRLAVLVLCRFSNVVGRAVVLHSHIVPLLGGLRCSLLAGCILRKRTALPPLQTRRYRTACQQHGQQADGGMFHHCFHRRRGLEQVGKGYLNLRGREDDAAAMFVADHFVGRRVGMPAQVVHVVDAYAAFEGQVPPLGQHPRVADRGTYARRPAVVAGAAVADLVLGEGRVQAPKQPHVRLEAPAAHADGRREDVGSQSLRRNRIPIARQLHRPLLRHGDIDARIECSCRPAQRIDAHGGVLGRCRVRRKDAQQQD